MAFKTIPEMFLTVTSEFADKKLYYHKRKDHWEGLRGKDIRQAVEDLAFGLKSLGVQKGVQAAILSGNSPRWAMADYAILCTGGSTVSIYPSLTAQQAGYILMHSDSRVVFAENEAQAKKVIESWAECPQLKVLVVMNEDKVAAQIPGRTDIRVLSYIELLDLGSEYAVENELDFEQQCRSIQADDLLTLIYTSGTTGDPKGAMLTHHNLAANVEATLQHLQVSSDDVLLSFLPLSHSAERMAGHFLAFSVGATIYYAESIEAVPQNMLEVKPTVMVSVPRLYEKIYARVLDSISQAPALRQKIFWWAMAQGEAVLDQIMTGQAPDWWLSMKHSLANRLVFSKLKERIGGRLRFFVSGGAPLSADIAEFFARAGIIIIEAYGLTETSPVLTTNKLEKFKFGSVGVAIPNVELKIAEDGEILARGPNIMKGYFKDPEATAEAINDDGWFLTGDIGELDEDGFLRITDRKKNLIVTSGGKNIAPAPLENALVSNPYIEQVLVIGDRRKFISALVVPNFPNLRQYASEEDISSTSGNDLLNNAEIVAFVQAQVNRAMEPFAHFEQVKKVALLPREFSIENGELTPTLKVKRKVVLEHYDDLIESLYSDAPGS